MTEQVTQLLSKCIDINAPEPGSGAPIEQEGENAQTDLEKAGLSALMAAVLSGQHDIVKSLLAAGVDPLMPDEKDIPAFLAPALADNPEMQRTFLDSGVSPDLESNAGGVTALMVATAKGSRELADLLLDAGANIDKLMGNGEPFFSHPKGVNFEMSALGCAVDGRHWELASHLLDRRAKPNFGVMHTDIALTLAKFAPLSLIEKMHGAGFPIVMDHQFILLFAPPVEMQLPQMRSKIVFWAAVNTDPAVLTWVLSQGGDPKAGNSLGMTALIVAAAVGNTPLVEQLLAQGADADIEDCDGDTALSLAVERGHAATVRVLRRHLSMNAQPDSAALTLHQAAARGAVAAVLDHLDNGVSPNVCDHEGNTPLMLAVKAGHIATLRVLFTLGASVRLRNTSRQTAWDLATETADKRVLVNLREFGASRPGKRDEDKRFDPLEVAQGRYAHPFKYPSRTP